MTAGIYRIRFHGRGGQGMKTASRMLGSAFFAAGLEVQDAPRYGAERRGAPIFAYVRASAAPIDERGIIRRPDLVVVADETLIPVPAAGVLAGITPRTVLLVASRDSPEAWCRRLNLESTILTLPDFAEGQDRPVQPLVGAACAGAAARLVGVIGQTDLAQAITDELGHLGDAVVAANRAQALAAYDRFAHWAGLVTPGAPADATRWEPPAWVDLPFEDARVAAPIIHAALTSEAVKTGAWRTLRPVVDLARCNRCWWICSTFCPDGAIQVDATGAPRIDYEHCKGCLICVAQCPPHAIAALPEREAAARTAAGAAP
jgi:pyruvate ferredoxin oxidoreductase gamma subunit